MYRRPPDHLGRAWPGYPRHPCRRWISPARFAVFRRRNGLEPSPRPPTVSDRGIGGRTRPGQGGKGEYTCPRDRSVIEADFVVVGAGSAGCVMAARLSEDPATRVVLLEAGGEDSNRWIHIPLGFGKTFADPSVNWCYETEPDPGANGRQSSGRAARCWAGRPRSTAWSTSAASTRISTCGGRWATPAGRATDVLPYFKRAEHQVRGADEWHGTGGPLAVSDVRDKHPIREAFIRARIDLGYPTQRRFQRRDAGRRRLPPDHHAQRQALLDRGRLSAPGDASGANLRVITGALARTDRRSRAARDRRAVPPGRRRAHGPRAARGDPVRRRDQLAAASAAVGHRPAGAPGGSTGIAVVHHLPGVGQACRTTTRRRSS